MGCQARVRGLWDCLLDSGGQISDTARRATECLTEDQWSLIEPLLPASDGCCGGCASRNNVGPRGHHLLLPGRVRLARRILRFRPWQTIWKRHCCCAVPGDRTWDTILASLLAHADSNGGGTPQCGYKSSTSFLPLQRLTQIIIISPASCWSEVRYSSR